MSALSPDRQIRASKVPRRTGSRKDHRAYVGPANLYDVMGAMQFNLLSVLGLRETHTVLDVGCGSLRLGRLLIPFLQPGHYCGVEPERALVETALDQEIGRDIVRLRHPEFRFSEDFNLKAFRRQFDFVVAQSIFSHASQAQVHTCLAQARSVTTQGSVMVATFLEGKEDYDGDAWVYPDCIPYTYATLRSMAQAEGLECRRILWPHPARQSWVAFTRPGTPLPGNPDGNVSAALYEAQLKQAQEELDRVLSYPFVRLGIKMRRTLRRSRTGT